MTIIRIPLEKLTIIGTIEIEAKKCTCTVTIRENFEPNEFYFHKETTILESLETSLFFNCYEEDYFDEVPDALNCLEELINYITTVLYDNEILFFHDRIWLEDDLYCEAVGWESTDYSTTFCYRDC